MKPFKNIGLDVDVTAFKTQAASLRQAATAIILREGHDGFEVLLLRRSGRGDLVNAVWVFPGGAFEAEDFQSDDDLSRVALRAAVRETHEEAGIRIEPTTLKPYRHWTTPEGTPKRFATWFFLASYQGDDVQVDDVEMVDHVWLTPQQALNLQANGEMVLLPPTFISLTELARYPSGSAAIEALSIEFGGTILPKACPLEDGVCMLYPGDSGYETVDESDKRCRHRFYMQASAWRYENDLS